MAVVQPFNSCCFSGGADGTQGSFKSMQAWRLALWQTVILIARICPTAPNATRIKSADRPLAPAVASAEHPRIPGTSMRKTTLRCRSSMGSRRARTNIANLFYCCLKQNTETQCARRQSAGFAALHSGKNRNESRWNGNRVQPVRIDSRRCHPDTGRYQVTGCR